MANPTGTRANRWNQVTAAIAGDQGITQAAADTWLNGVWANMYVDEVFGNVTTHAALRKWLEVNSTGAGTLPAALRMFVT